MAHDVLGTLVAREAEEPEGVIGTRAGESGGRLSRGYRIMHVIPSLDLGGAQMGVAELAACQSREYGHDVSVCVLLKASGRERVDFTSGIDVIHLGYGGMLSDLAETLRCVRMLRGLIGRRGVEIVHTHLWLADLLGAAATGRSGAVQVVHLRDTRPWMRERSGKARLRRLLFRMLMAYSGANFIAVAKAVAEYAEKSLGIRKELMRVVANGVDLKRFRGIGRRQRGPQGVTTIGAAGRFVPEKGFEHLIHAVARLKNKGRRVRLLLAGSGGLESAYFKLAAGVGIGEDFGIVGPAEDMADFYAGLDVFVLPSLYGEGMPRVLIEAMALGVPVVATRDAGIPELVRDGIDGLLVESGDSQALAEAIEVIISDPRRAQEMVREAGRRVTGCFNAARVCREVCDVYDELITARRRRGRVE